MDIQLTSNLKIIPSIRSSSIDSESGPSENEEEETAEQNDKMSGSRVRLEVPSVASICCRICLTDGDQERLIQPCYCKGTIAYVHRSCLENWLNQTSSTFCELCHYNYDVELNHRYTVLQSLRIWLHHPRIVAMMRGDIVIATLITIIMVGLVVLSFLGSEIILLEVQALGIAEGWSTSSVSVFLGAFFLGYLFVLYLLFKSHIYLWYTWYRRCVNVRLRNVQKPPPRVVLQPKQQQQEEEIEEEEINPSTSQQVECTTIFERASARALETTA